MKQTFLYHILMYGDNSYLIVAFISLSHFQRGREREHTNNLGFHFPAAKYNQQHKFPLQ